MLQAPIIQDEVPLERAATDEDIDEGNIIQINVSKFINSASRSLLLKRPSQ